MCLLGQTLSSVPVIAALSVEFAVVLLSGDIRLKLQYPQTPMLGLPTFPFIIIATVTLVRSCIEATHSLELARVYLAECPCGS